MRLIVTETPARQRARINAQAAAQRDATDRRVVERLTQTPAGRSLLQEALDNHADDWADA